MMFSLDGTIKKSTFDNGVLFYLFLFFIVLMMFSLDGIDDV